MKIKLFFTNNDYVIIDVYSQFNEWFDYFYHLSKDNHYLELFSKVEPYKKNFISRYKQKKLIDHCWGVIVENSYLLHKEYNLTIDNLPTSFNFSQNTLNNIHRFFTKNSMSEKLPKHLLKPINECVHTLESFCPTSNKSFVKKLGTIKALELRGKTKESSFYYQLSSKERKISSSYIDYSLGLPVFLNDFILGKPYIQSFYDEDNPREDDITGRAVSDGGFVIDINHNRKKLYQSKRFLKWFENHNLKTNNLPLETQIGYVKESSCSLKKIYYHFLLGFDLKEIVLEKF